MPVIPVPLGPGGTPSRSKAMGEPVLINCFPEASDGGKQPFAIYSDPGLTEYVDFSTTDGIRGLFVSGSKRYAVVGEKLYSIEHSGAYTLVGTVLGTAPVITAANKKATPQVCIVADNTVYVLESETLSTFTDADLPSNVHSVAYMDGYGIFGIRDGRFFISALNEFDDVDALDFADAEGDPDGGVRVFVSGRELYYFGEKSTEVFTNTGASFPFERLPGGFMPVGCKAKLTPANFDNSVVWVTGGGLVVRSEAYTARRISNHGVERDIQSTIDAQLADSMEAFVYREGGHEFYVLSSGTWTWVYDAATRLWHKKESYGLSRSRIRGYVRSADKHVVGDSSSGKLHFMSMSAHDEAGDNLVTTIRSPIISEPGIGFTWDSLLLDMQMGVGRGTGAHSADPKVTLRWTDDGYQTWKGSRERSLGANGQFSGRIQFNDLGASGFQGRAFEVSISSPVERCVIGASAVVRPTGAG